MKRGRIYHKNWQAKREKRLAREVLQHVQQPRRWAPTVGDKVVYEDMVGTITAIDQDWVLWCYVDVGPGRKLLHVRVSDLVPA